MATYTDFSDVHTNLARPKNSAILTVRVIKSFQYRTERSLVLKDINLETTTVGQLKDISRQAIQIQSGWKPYRNVELDAMKLYSQAHGAKTTNLIINLDHDEWILTDDSKTLAEAGFENETEVSFFNRDLYEQFRHNPKTTW
ncbi:cytoplasmic protein [Lentinula guzmanii]|uniref:Cytoplasmic protein n=1 Tax=Lentinula guzmanii TaxID=2804957 RepID=A0AA38JE61_9AGAR|nr:cytoplasmic protein [Lentinula guzmanii]